MIPAPKLPQTDIRSWQDLEVQVCTDGGVSHDYRPFVHLMYGKTVCSWRCVWCHALACGSYDDPDPCLQPQFHEGPHETKADQL